MEYNTQDANREKCVGLFKYHFITVNNKPLNLDILRFVRKQTIGDLLKITSLLATLTVVKRLTVKTEILIVLNNRHFQPGLKCIIIFGCV